MAILDYFSETGSVHPIDLAETLAEMSCWDFDRVGEDQISMIIEGQWRTHSVSLTWSQYEEKLCLFSSFAIEPTEDRLGVLYEALNLANDQCGIGSFTYWKKEKLLNYRYVLLLDGESEITSEQINKMLENAINLSERFYPAFQLVCWGDRSPQYAIQIAIAEAIGHA